MTGAAAMGTIPREQKGWRQARTLARGGLAELLQQTPLCLGDFLPFHLLSVCLPEHSHQDQELLCSSCPHQFPCCGLPQWPKGTGTGSLSEETGCLKMPSQAMWNALQEASSHHTQWTPQPTDRPTPNNVDVRPSGTSAGQC